MNDPTDPFFEPYDRDDVAYGATPSAALNEYLRQIGGTGKALDLGAGAGRDTIALANAGFQVTAVDLSDRGSQRIVERAGNPPVLPNLFRQPLAMSVRSTCLRDLTRRSWRQRCWIIFPLPTRWRYGGASPLR